MIEILKIWNKYYVTKEFFLLIFSLLPCEYISYNLKKKKFPPKLEFRFDFTFGEFYS